jgi:LysM repeat protein
MGRHAKRSKARAFKIAGAVGGGAMLPVVAPVAAHAEQLTPADVTAIAQEGCPELSSAELDTAVRIAGAESDLETTAHNPYGEDSRGLWQINVSAHGSPWGDLFDPVTNARAMCDISSGGSDWTPWTTYASGAYLSEAGATAGGVAPSTPDVPATPAPSQGHREHHRGGRTYTVQDGDTLWGIAGHHWQRLYERNRHVIGDNPDLIYPGQELRTRGRHGRHQGGGQDTPTTPTDPPSDPATGGFSHPVPGATISQGYGVPGDYATGYHTGTDFSVPTGTEVLAVSDGEVVASDTSSAYGINVQIKHDDGRYSLYAHLSSAAVSPGQRVSAGTVIGYSGSTGNSTGPHLHLEIRTVPTYGDGNFLDPVQYLRDNGVEI